MNNTCELSPPHYSVIHRTDCQVGARLLLSENDGVRGEDKLG